MGNCFRYSSSDDSAPPTAHHSASPSIFSWTAADTVCRGLSGGFAERLPSVASMAGYSMSSFRCALLYNGLIMNGILS